MMSILYLLLLLLGQQAVTGSIQGTVVRAGTVQVLAGETVGLWPTTRTAKTNAEGKFQFQDVAPGEYALTVVRDGMKVQVQVTITAARRSETLTLEVKSPPAITGTVFDPNGERVAASLVQAYRTVYAPTGPRLRSVMSVLSDDLGEYRLFWLRPGEYYVSASLSDREQRIGLQGLHLTTNLSKPDDGFPAIYFGGGYSPYQSQKVRLNRDTDTTSLQLFLKDGPRFSVSGRLLPEGACARVALVPEGGFINTDNDFSANFCGTYRVTGLSPGTYFLFAMNEAFASQVIPVVIATDSVETNVTLLGTVSISGRVSGEGGFGQTAFNPGTGLPASPFLASSTADSGSTVRLSRSSRDIGQDIEAPIGNNGAFMIPYVPVGQYDVSIQPWPDGTARYVRAITYGPTDGLTSPIYVDGSPPRVLNIQMGLSNATAQGVVVDRSGKPVPGAEVVLVPRSQRTRADRYLATTADAGGNFRVVGIPPVDYALLAFEELEPQAYFAFAYDQGLYNRYAINAEQLSSGASNTMLRLIAIPASETAGGLR